MVTITICLPANAPPGTYELAIGGSSNQAMIRSKAIRFHAGPP